MQNRILKLILVAMLFWVTNIEKNFAQGCNPSLGSMTFDESCIVQNQTTTMTVNWTMGGGDPTCVAPVGSWMIQISPPASGEYDVTNIPTGINGPGFTWALSSDGNTINGTNNIEIAWLDVGVVEVTFEGVASTVPLCGPVLSSGNIFIIPLAPPLFNGSPGSFQNVPGDDAVQASLAVDLLTILPVELLSFTGRKVDKAVQLDWTTVTEQNNEGFEIHKSVDGRDWDIIGWVDGNGTVTRTIDYSLIDKAPFIGDNYYRLQQFDFDGRSEFSNTIIVNNLGKEAAINILPNPSSGPFTVAVENPNNEKMRVTLYDSAGQLIWKSGLIEDKKVWRKDFNLIQKEMYFISVEIGKEVISEKILIIDRA